MVILLFAACATTPTAAPAPPPIPAAPPPPPEPPPPPPRPRSPDGVEMADCPEVLPEGMACVPGGPFVRGTDAVHECNQGENRRETTLFGPATTLWMQTFLVDTTEVTYEAYKECVSEKRCTNAGPRYNDYNRPKQPHMGADWFQARDYCKAMGKHLPTEAEYEKAARGPDGDDTPYGKGEPTCDQAVVMTPEGLRSCGVQKLPPNPEKGRTLEVGSRPAGRYGTFDLVGNAEEWVADWFARDPNACGTDCLGTDPKGPCGGADACPGYTLKMVKGGSWYWEPRHAAGWHRRPHVPTNSPYHHFGFRCAASLPEAAAMVAHPPEPTPAEPTPPAPPPPGPSAP